LLVVLTIMGVMLGLLLPALQGARNRAQATVCENNIRQLDMALRQSLSRSKRDFPGPNHWTVDLLPWIEQRPLADAMKYNRDPNPKFPRPPLMQCPMQSDFPSRVESVGFCHYVLVIDRFPNGQMERGWEIQDRPLLSEDVTEEPWYIGPEISYFMQEQLFADEPGPHPPGQYMTTSGPRPQ